LNGNGSTAMAGRKVKLTLELSEDVNNNLEEIAEQNSTTKSDGLRRAISLVSFAASEKKKGRELAIIDSKSEKVVSRIVGV
jgi:predicted transcriptional regulator